MIRTAHRRPLARRGFTLVELLVAAAICVLIMSILATCFTLGIDTMRDLKAKGDMVGQLRAASTVLRRDLGADHFLDEDGKPGQGRRVSDQELDKLRVIGSTGNYQLVGWTPPRAGFFRVKSDPVVFEGVDADSLSSSRATNHCLHFTSILSGSSEEERYSTNVPGVGQLTSRAAEIAYFLDPVSIGFTNGPGSTPLYQLIRRQRLAARTAAETGNYPTTDAGVVSLRAGPAVNSLADLTNPANRLIPVGAPAVNPSNTANDSLLAALATRPGDDILLSNVISFEVQVTWIPTLDSTNRLPVLPPMLAPSVPTYPPPGYNYPRNFGTNLTTETTEYPFDYLRAVPNTGNTNLRTSYIFDTWANLGSGTTKWDTLDQTAGPTAGRPTTASLQNFPPMLIRVKAVQIRIRVWDTKIKSARQTTIVQDL